MKCNECPRLEALEQEVKDLKAVVSVQVKDWDQLLADGSTTPYVGIQERLDKIEAHIDEPGCVQWVDRVNKSIEEQRKEFDDLVKLDRAMERSQCFAELARAFKSCDCGDNWVAFNDHFKRYGGNIDELFKKLEAMEEEVKYQTERIASCPGASYEIEVRLNNLEGMVKLLRNVQKED